MEVLETLDELRRARRIARGRLGFVATMGGLHPGHEALLRAARMENKTVVASIFVNPTQFGEPADFDEYPRDRDRDLEILNSAEVDLVWAPSMEEMYPEGMEITVEVGAIGSRLEGASRAGHFNGVATVVAKLFNQVRPDVTYFGQKDWQQTRVIEALVEGLRLDVEVKVVRTVRETDGLAWSSRNLRLDGPAREAAAVLYRALRAAEEAFAGGETDGDALRRLINETVATEPRAQLDYASLAHAEHLEELTVARTPLALLGAIEVGDVRLIDNVVIGVELWSGDGAGDAHARL
jgi:pantoate--beta-alanine ligase